MPGFIATASPSVAAGAGEQPRRQGTVLALLASLFFIWGFITVINGTLLPHLRSVFQLSYTQTTLIESVWFIAYFVASLPAAFLIERIGYKRALVAGLLVMATGALAMTPAASLPSFPLTLCALFVIAGGVTILQVAANPYVAVIGPAETAPARLNLVQAFNSLGTTLAPLFGAYLILGRSRSGSSGADLALSPAERLADAHSVVLPYLIVAGVLMVLAVVIARFRLPDIATVTTGAPKVRRRRAELLRYPNLVFGVAGIFIYLFAEIGVGNLFVSFVSQPEIGNMTHQQGGEMLFLLWGGMMVGRFVGGFLMNRIAAERVLAVFALAALCVMLVVVFTTGHLAMWALCSVGLFHSIMFPTIFTLAIRGLGPLTAEGAGLLIMAIAGGALVIVQGRLADAFGLHRSFLLTAACELYVLFYAVWCSRSGRTAEAEPVLGDDIHGAAGVFQS